MRIFKYSQVIKTQRRSLLREVPGALASLAPWLMAESHAQTAGRPSAGQAGPQTGTDPLPRAEAWESTLQRAAKSGQVLVVLWGTPGCPWCAALRKEVMVHLWRDAARQGLQVYEFDLTDRMPLLEQPALSPAQLAARLGIRVSPTVSFHGPAGELAERLVGYASRDFYPAYLDERLRQARNMLKGG